MGPSVPDKLTIGSFPPSISSSVMLVVEHMVGVYFLWKQSGMINIRQAYGLIFSCSMLDNIMYTEFNRRF